ncbi:hypothetical protein HPULCUR_005889 [Helicostylum pulchrum]|uniref:Uncharacterized protein n=1 Tax=Helicostylum pulchrum TaxID=562976 RepID=A0ABP9Y0C1_9FUNG
MNSDKKTVQEVPALLDDAFYTKVPLVVFGMGNVWKRLCQAQKKQIESDRYFISTIK